MKLQAIDQPDGSNYECEATSIDESGTEVHYLLNDSESHLTVILTYDLVEDKMLESDTRILPYETSHAPHTYRSQRAVIFDHDHFAMVNIDTMLYGLPGPTNYQLGYLIDSSIEKRRNAYMDSGQKEVVLSIETSFYSNPFSKSFLYLDKKLEK